MLQPFLVPESPDHGRYNYRPINKIVMLDPSAGKGDICDYVKDTTNDKTSIYCIEIDPNLKHILHGKGYRVIADDFLEYSGDHCFDLIAMNPPFSNGVDHVLKAWSIMENGHIVSLLNSETIRNPYTEKRKHLVSLIEKFGSVEHIGQVFMNSKDYIKVGSQRYRNDEGDEYDDGGPERTTTVECCIVRLEKKTERTKFDFEFKSVNSEKHVDLNEETFQNPVATRDVIGNMIIKYDHMKAAFVNYMKVIDELCFYGQDLIYSTTDKETGNVKTSGPSDTARDAYTSPSSKRTKKASYNQFCDNIKADIWSYILRTTNIQKYMTHSVRQNWREFCNKQGFMDFTKENVASIIAMIFNNRYEILEKAIVEVFDMFTAHHKDNRYLIEGWKTNDKWKVNRKIIMPYAVKMSWDTKYRLQWGAEYQMNYSRSSEYSDIDKVLCYITGKDHDKVILITDALQRAFNEIGKIKRGPHTHKCQSTFFDIQFYMKGTMHLTFRSKELWEEFNMRACAGKMWLPENEAKAWQEKKNPPKPAEKQQLQLEAAVDDEWEKMFEFH